MFSRRSNFEAKIDEMILLSRTPSTTGGEEDFDLLRRLTSAQNLLKFLYLYLQKNGLTFHVIEYVVYVLDDAQHI